MPAQTDCINKTYKRSSLQDKFQKMQNLLLCGDQIFKNLGKPYEKFSGMRVIFVTSTGKHLINTLEKISIIPPFKDKNVFLFSHQQEIKKHGAWHARYALKNSDGAIKTTTLTTLLQQH